MSKDTSNEIFIDKMDFKGAIKLLKNERARYGKGKVEITNEFERGFVRGLEEAAALLKQVKDTVDL